MRALVAESYKHRTGMGPGKDIVQQHAHAHAHAIFISSSSSSKRSAYQAI
jgi:hypothetical protein